jgi:pilus assembly protein TadC
MCYFWALSSTGRLTTGPGEVSKFNRLKEKNIMRLSRPKVITFWIAVILAVLGVLALLGSISPLSGYAFWLVVAGFVLLALGNLLKDL